MTERPELGIVDDAADALAVLEVTTTNTAVPEADHRDAESVIWSALVLVVLGLAVAVGVAGTADGTPGRGWWALIAVLAGIACAGGGWLAVSAGAVRDGRAVMVGAAGVFACGVVLLTALPRAFHGMDQGLAAAVFAPLFLAVGLAASVASGSFARVLSTAARNSQVVVGIAVVPALVAVVVTVLDVHSSSEPAGVVIGILSAVVAAVAAVVAALGARRAPRLYVPAGLGLGLCSGAGVAAAIADTDSGDIWFAAMLVTAAAGVATAGVFWGYSKGRRVVVAVESIIDWAPSDDLADHLGEAADTLVEAAGISSGGDEGAAHRVIQHALGIARELDLPPARMRVISLGALFHDVGKIAIPEQILNKPGALTDAERQLVEQHSLAGYQLASRINLLWEAALAIRHHHEWVDGSGYPDGLQGDAIPIESRIIAVCDMYDALTTDRPYRDAMSPEEAFVLMRAEVGTHLDPECFAAFERHERRAHEVVPFPGAD